MAFTPEQRAAWHKAKGPEYHMWRSARKRARRDEVPCDIKPEDIVIPEVCPVLGILMVHGEGKASFASPTLDRFLPELGYVKGNIEVISLRANSIKRHYSTETIGLVYKWMLNR